MPVHTVREGECLATIARMYGFRDWRTIYQAAENAEFRRKRPNPNVIFEGDEIQIPETNTREEQVVTDRRHKFVTRLNRWVFRVHMRDETGTAIENEPYELRITGHRIIHGRTGDGGLIEAPVPDDVQEATLVFCGEEFRVWLGGLDPISRVKGLQARLNNLGYGAGPVDGILGPKTRQALYRFQRLEGLPATGLVDDDTRKRLLEVHDGDTRLTPPEEDMGPATVPPLERDTLPPGLEPEPATADAAEEYAWRSQRSGYEEA